MIYVIGIGPGDKRLMTGEALQAIEDAEVIVGYVTYIKLIKELIKDKEVVKTGMRREIDRCQEAVDIALTGKKVSSCFKRRCRNLRYGWSSFRTRRKKQPRFRSQSDSRNYCKYWSGSGSRCANHARFLSY